MREQPIGRGALVLACAVTLALGAPGLAGADTTTPPTLRAVGSGMTFVTPDSAAVTISVARAGSSAGGARARENTRLAAILAGLRGTGLPAADIQSSQISLRREGLGTSPGHRARFRWVASGTLTVDTMRVDLLSRIFAAASHGGADSFDGPNYRLSDPSAGKLAAEAAAVRDARRRADNAAAAAGVRVIGVQTIDLDPGSGALGAPGAAGAPAPSQAGRGHAPIPTPTSPGKQEVDATANVVFLIGA